MTRDRLVIVLADAVDLGPGSMRLSSKSLQALEHYARRWDGPVLVSVERKVLPRSPLLREVRLADCPFDVVDRERLPVRRVRERAAVTLALHAPEDPGVIAMEPRRLVHYGEVPVAERIRIGQVGAGPVGRLRVRAGWLRRGRRLRTLVRDGGGYQANGYPAWTAAADLSPSPLLYFDTRITQGVLADGSAPRDRLRPGPLVLGFSGRHTAIKGPDHALDAVARAVRSGADVRVVLYGDGELTPALREQARELGDRATFRGSVPFEEAWVPEVSRDIDVMLLPHIQGDPSGTYLEAAALGVPVLGFANAALAPLADRHGIGWTVRLGDRGALAAEIGRLATDRAEVARRGTAGRAFMREHVFEREFDRRIAHLRDVADR